MQWLRRMFGQDGPPPAEPRVTVRLPKETVADLTGFTFSAEWTCEGACAQNLQPTKLRIRARQDRAAGPSNFEAYPKRHRFAGTSKLPSHELTWNGLAEERGWQTTPKVLCPACLEGAVSVEEYRAAVKAGKSLDEYRKSQLALPGVRT